MRTFEKLSIKERKVHNDPDAFNLVAVSCERNRNVRGGLGFRGREELCCADYVLQ